MRESFAFSFADDLDLMRIAQSGQCFRMTQHADGAFRVLAGIDVLRIRKTGENRFSVDCAQAQWEKRWKSYFDMGENYARIRERIDPKTDPDLFAACEAQKGIRILHQDVWETLVSFLISQNRSIPLIRTSIETLCHRYGTACEDRYGEVYHAFPTPAQIAALSEDALLSCKMGYRSAYILRTARDVAEGRVDLLQMQALPDAALLERLKTLYGVGPKVALCVMLFGFHRLNALPVDTWIRKAMAVYYPKGYPAERLAPFNGVYQQYLFAYARDHL